MVDKGIALSWNGTACSCRCDHCLLSSGIQPSCIPYNEAKEVVDSFLLWRKDSDRNELKIDFAAGYSVDFPQLLDYVKYRIRNRLLGADSLQVGGIRKRTVRTANGTR